MDCQAVAKALFLRVFFFRQNWNGHICCKVAKEGRGPQTHGPRSALSVQEQIRQVRRRPVGCPTNRQPEATPSSGREPLPQDTSSMRIQARCAERPRMGGASLARADARVFTKSSDSVLHRPPCFNGHDDQMALISPWRSSAYFLSLSGRAGQHSTVHPVCLLACIPAASQSASQSDVHGELSSMAERERGRQHFNGPFGRCCHCDIHVAEFDVEPHRGPLPCKFVPEFSLVARLFFSAGLSEGKRPSVARMCPTLLHTRTWLPPTAKEDATTPTPQCESVQAAT